MSRPGVMDVFADWLRSDLPRRNQGLSESSLGVGEFAREASHWVSALTAEIDGEPEALPRDLAREALQLVSFPVNSLERQVQLEGGAPGAGLALLPGAEDLLLDLGAAADHPPCASHYTAWLWNRGASPITFTGDPQEEFFLRAVVRTDDLNRTAAASLREIADGTMRLGSPESHHHLEIATRCLRDLRQLYASFMNVDCTTGLRPIEPAFFATQMRTYYVSYPVGGRLWSGVNAGNLASQIQLDYLIGTVTEDYAERIISRRLPFQTDEDRAAIHQDMRRGSVLTRALDLLALGDCGDLTAEVWRRAADATPEIAETARCVAGLIKANGEWAATHYALIVNYLARPGVAPAEGHTRLPVALGQGTGGMKHEETRQIMEMRRRHPVAGTLPTKVDPTTARGDEHDESARVPENRAAVSPGRALVGE